MDTLSMVVNFFGLIGISFSILFITFSIVCFGTKEVESDEESLLGEREVYSD